MIKTKRIPQIDIIKGFAVILMVIFHYFYLGSFLEKLNLPLSESYTGIYFILAKSAHTIFILMVGFNLSLSRFNSKNNISIFYKKQLIRSLEIAILAIVVSALSYLAFSENWIKFGILHFIAISILLALPFANKPNLSITLATFLLIIYFYITLGAFVNFHDIIPGHIAFILGIYNPGIYSYDYFSIIPYFSVILLGIYFCHTMYDEDNRRLKYLEFLNYIKFKNYLIFLGKHSLAIYFIHYIILYFYFYIT